MYRVSPGEKKDLRQRGTPVKGLAYEYFAPAPGTKRRLLTAGRNLYAFPSYSPLTKTIITRGKIIVNDYFTAQN